MWGQVNFAHDLQVERLVRMHTKEHEPPNKLPQEASSKLHSRPQAGNRESLSTWPSYFQIRNAPHYCSELANRHCHVTGADVNESEAETVKKLFRLYVEYGCLRLIEREAHKNGLRSKRHVYATGRSTGGKPFSRGQICYILRNLRYRVQNDGLI